MDFFPGGGLHGPYNMVRVPQRGPRKPKAPAHRLDEVESVVHDDHGIGNLKEIILVGSVELVGETSLDVSE
jgi:hypothetical protein